MVEVEIKSNIKLGIAEILEGIAKLDIEELELFLNEAKGILVQKKTKRPQEIALIQKIHSSYPIDLKEEYESLKAKINSQKISEQEEKRLIELSDKFEALDAKRLEYLIELSQLRSQPLSTTLKEFSPTNPNA